MSTKPLVDERELEDSIKILTFFADPDPILRHELLELANSAIRKSPDYGKKLSSFIRKYETVH